MSDIYKSDIELFVEKYPTIKSISIDVVQNHVDDDAPPSVSRQWHFDEKTIQNQLPCTYKKCSDKGGLKLFNILSRVVANKLLTYSDTHICSNGCKNNPRSTCANSFKVTMEIEYQESPHA